MDNEVKLIFENRNRTLEKMFEKESGRLGWHYTDVLYSCLGTYIIGLYALDKE